MSTANPDVVNLVASLVNNAPGKLLPAHKRYALSQIADGQSLRLSSDEFTKAAAGGVSPDALAADKAGEAMAKVVGIDPPPMPNPMAMGQEAFQNASASGTVAGTPQGTTLSPQGQPGTVAPATATAQPGPSNPPPNTYFDTSKGVSVYDPNYHGPYAAFPGSWEKTMGPEAPAQSESTTALQTGEMPEHKFAPLDQGRIDEAWNQFDRAMATMPTRPKPHQLPEVGMTQLLAMVAAGIIDPQAGAIIGKAIFEAPVMAKQLMDKEDDQFYEDSVNAWKNNTQRLLGAAQSVERSEISKQKNLQGTYDMEFERDSKLFNDREKRADLNARSARNKMADRLRNLDSKIYEGKLSADQVGEINKTRNQIQAFLNSDMPMYDEKGEPTPGYLKLQQDIDESESRIAKNEATVTRIQAATGLDQEKVYRMQQLLPYEMDKMAAQTAGYNADVTRKIYDAMLIGARIDDIYFRQQLATDKFRLDKTKASMQAVEGLLKARRTDRDNLAKEATKAREKADKLAMDYPPDPKTGKSIMQEEIDANRKLAEERQAEVDKLDGPNGSIDTLSKLHETLRKGIESIEAPQSKQTSPSYQQVSNQVQSQGGQGRKGLPATVRYNNPGAQYPGPSSKRFGSTGTEIIGGGHKIAVFPSVVHGGAAQFDLLARSYAGMTLRSAIRRWSGNNSADSYVSGVSRATGISPDTVITKELLNSPKGIALAKAMARHETGHDYPMTDQQWQGAQEMAFGKVQANRTPRGRHPSDIAYDAGDK